MLLDRSVLDADVQARLLQQTGGNPLYAEEYARMLVQGESGEALPDTVQGVIAARLDLLEPGEKEVIQAASVLGKVFWRGGVEALGPEAGLDETLQRLVRREFIKRERGSSDGRARRSTRSGTHSSETSPTRNCRAPRAPRSTASPRAGSRRPLSGGPISSLTTTASR